MKVAGIPMSYTFGLLFLNLIEVGDCFVGSLMATKPEK